MLARRAIDMHMQLKADGTGLLSPGGSIIPIESEEHVFRLLNLPYRIPEDRE
jgi:DNA polymerase/3'-5' exonuclease PolX